MSLPRTRVTQALTIAFALLGPSAAHAQAIKTELPDSLVKQATVPEGTARAAAMAKVPKGTLQAVELEREKGHLQYSYDIKVPGQKGITEVNVDAMTGTVLGVEHEDLAAEKKEGAKKAAPKAKGAKS